MFIAVSQLLFCILIPYHGIESVAETHNKATNVTQKHIYSFNEILDLL